MSTPPPRALDLDHAWGHAVDALGLTTLPVGERPRSGRPNPERTGHPP